MSVANIECPHGSGMTIRRCVETDLCDCFDARADLQEEEDNERS